MPRVWSKTNPASAGFSVVEVLLAVTIFGFLATAFVGALVYGISSSDQAGDRARAAMLADEGIQATRNIKDAAYSNLVDGTYGLVQSGGVWTLSGASDTSDIYTRQITVASAGTNRKTVTSKVTWTDSVGNSRQVSAVAQFSNWMASIKSWTNATINGSYDASGTVDGYKVATSGNYAYLIRNSGSPNFLVINISNPAAPTLAASLTLATNPTNIFISGNYAYVTTSSDTAELQIVNITTPTSPTLVSSYNASGNADGQDVYVSGNYAYVARAANGGTAEFVIVNIATPASPTLVGSYGNNVSMKSVAVSSSGYAYIGTATGVLLVVKVSTPASPTLATSQTLTTLGSVNAADILNNTLLLGQSNALSIIDISTPATPARTGTVTTSGLAAINDIDTDPTGTYAFLATSNIAAEFQIANISNPASASIIKTIDVTGITSNLNGIAYNEANDIVVGASSSDTQELITFIKN